MIKRTLKSHCGFKSETVEMQIIGGKTDFCAERFGYKRGTDGITPSMGLTAFAPATSFANAQFAEYLPLCRRTVFKSTTGQLAEWRGSGTVNSLGTLTSNFPSVLPCYGGGYKYVITSGYSLAKINSDGTAEIVDIPVKLLSSVMHCGRIFSNDVDDRYMLRWSGYDFGDWTEKVDGAGHVRLKPRLGRVLNLFVIGEKIAAVREYGITLMSTLGDFRHMRVELGETRRLPRVYENGSAICGGQLWIYTRGGMFVFDGNNLTKAPFDTNMLGYSLTNPEVLDERYIYYSATRGSQTCLFEYDTETGAGTPFADGCKCMFFTVDGGYCFNGSALYRLSYGVSDANRRWVSEAVDPCAGKSKTLKGVLVEGSGDVAVEIDCDGRKVHADGVGRTNFSECGRKFTFKVTGEGSVTALTAEWEVRK